MENLSRYPNRIGNRVVVVQGSLALLAFSLMLAVAARGIQSLPNVQAQQAASDSAGHVGVSAQTEAGAKTVQADVFTGTIVKDGTVLVFRDQSGKVYRLKTQESANRYEGKSVKVTGKLEEETGLLLVDKIERVKQ